MANGRTNTFPETRGLLREVRGNMRQDRLRQEQIMRETPEKDAYAIRAVGNSLMLMDQGTRLKTQEGLSRSPRWQRIRQRNPQWFDQQSGFVLTGDTRIKDFLEDLVDAAITRGDKQEVLRLMGFQKTQSESIQEDRLRRVEKNVSDPGYNYADAVREQKVEATPDKGLSPTEYNASFEKVNRVIIEKRNRNEARYKDKMKLYLDRKKKWAVLSDEERDEMPQLKKDIKKFRKRMSEQDEIIEDLYLEGFGGSQTAPQAQQPPPAPSVVQPAGTQAAALVQTQAAPIDVSNWGQPGSKDTYNVDVWNEDTVFTYNGVQLTGAEWAEKSGKSWQQLKEELKALNRK